MQSNQSTLKLKIQALILPSSYELHFPDTDRVARHGDNLRQTPPSQALHH